MTTICPPATNVHGHAPILTARDILKYIGPGLLVTVGFIDPGNWASNVAAGAGYGYQLLWMVTLSTIMLIVVQHNSAHLGIASGLCLSEAASSHLPCWLARGVLGSAMAAAVSTVLAEILGAAIALRMLFGLPLAVGGLLAVVLVAWMLLSNSYQRLERYIIGFVSLIGLAFVFELALVKLDWSAAAAGWVTPAMPEGSLPIIMSVMGAVVMPHNLYLHSEIIQSRQWNLENDELISHQLKYEFIDTLFSMVVGWGINSAMILLAAATFFTSGTPVSELEQAQTLLGPLLGQAASVIFALALLMAGISSSVTAAMAGGTISAGLFKEPYDISDPHSRFGVWTSLVLAYLIILVLPDAFQGLIYSQIALSLQLPATILLLVMLTSSRKVMGKYANSSWTTFLLAVIGITVSVLDLMLVYDFVTGK